MVHKRVTPKCTKSTLCRHQSGFADGQEICRDRHIPRKFRSKDHLFTSLGTVALCSAYIWIGWGRRRANPGRQAARTETSVSHCEKAFTRPSSLRTHTYTRECLLSTSTNLKDTGERPYANPHPTCTRRFSVHSNLKRHSKVHGHNNPLQERLRTAAFKPPYPTLPWYRTPMEGPPCPLPCSEVFSLPPVVPSNPPQTSFALFRTS
jgi:hypothetical protein